MSRLLAPLALGLVLGGSATWFATRLRSSTSDTPFINQQSSILSAWSWRDSATPPTLAADAASTAISAWLTLRSPDGSPAAFSTRADALRALLVRLPAAAFSRVLDQLGDTKLSDDDRALRQIAFSAWTEADPAAAATWAVANPDRQAFASQALLAWSARDHQTAAAWACTLSDETIARRLATLALPPLAARDASQALALASARGDAFLDAVLPALLATLAKSDPASALRTYGPRLWKNGDGFWQLRDSLGAWTMRDPAAALTWIYAQPGRRDGQISRWIGELAPDGPQRVALANTLATLPGIPSRQAALGSLIFRWIAKSPEEAVAWLDSLSDRHLRNAILERAATTTYSDHPERSLPLALALPEGARRTERLGQLLGQWAGKDASAALAWLRENSAAPGVASASASAQASILGTIARDEPATAVAEWQALPAGDLKTQALANIALAWGQNDPAAALQWAAEQAKNFGVPAYQSDELVYSWARKDGPAALRWAESLPEENTRRRALNALSGTWQNKAPRAATADLYAQIKDPATRTQLVTNHVQEWLAKDRAAAQAWLESHDALSPAEAAALLAASPGPKN